MIYNLITAIFAEYFYKEKFMKEKFQVLGFIAITAIVVFTVACGSGPTAKGGQIPAELIGRWYHDWGGGVSTFSFEITADGYQIETCPNGFGESKNRLFFQKGVLMYQKIDENGNPMKSECPSMWHSPYFDENAEPIMVEASPEKFEYTIEPDGRLRWEYIVPMMGNMVSYYIKGE